MKCKLLLISFLFWLPLHMYSQDTTTLYGKAYSLPDKFFGAINSKSQKVESKITAATFSYLSKLEKQEKRLKKKLAKTDPAAAEKVFGDIDKKYGELNASVTKSSVVNDVFKNVYSGRMDSIKTSLNFLNASGVINNQPELNKLLSQYKSLQGSLNKTDDIKKYIEQRQAYLKQQLENLGLTKEFRKFQKEVYYYRAQVDEYKKALEDPNLAEQKLLEVANRIPAFRSFFAKYSDLGQLFRLPGADPSDMNVAIASGLQTRAMIQQLFQQQFGTGPNVNQMIQQNVQGAQAQLNGLKNKLESLKSGDNVEDIPGFKPNNQKTKSFWNRLELGTNLQTGKSNSFFPATSDLGLSVGYKLNDKSVIGVGASYKMGWGQNIRNLKITQEGVGFRSFLDWKLKGSFYASGGFEYNYQKAFNSMQALYVFEDWQQSGLLGVSKIVSLNNKFLKKTKVQLLWDFLSYQQRPAGQPIKFRFGYNF